MAQCAAVVFTASMDGMDREGFELSMPLRGTPLRGRRSGATRERIVRHDARREEREVISGAERILRVRALSDQGLEEIREEMQLLAALEIDGVLAAPTVLSVEQDGYDRESAPPFEALGMGASGGRRRALGASPGTLERKALAGFRQQIEEFLDSLHERGWVLGAPNGSGLGVRRDGGVVVIDLSGLTPSTSAIEAHADHRWTDSVLHDSDRTLRRRMIAPAAPPSAASSGPPAGSDAVAAEERPVVGAPPTASAMPIVMTEDPPAMISPHPDAAARLDPWLSPPEAEDATNPATASPSAQTSTEKHTVPGTAPEPAASAIVARMPGPAPAALPRADTRAQGTSTSSARPAASRIQSSPTARTPTFRSIAGEGDEMLKRAAALDRLGAREGLGRSKRRRRARLFGLWATAVLFTGGTFGLGTWYATSSTGAEAEAPAATGSSRPDESRTGAVDDAAEQRAEESAVAAAPDRVEDPVALATQLVAARYDYITGTSDEPVSDEGSASRDEDDAIRDAYADLEVIGGMPVVHEAEVVEGPEDGALLLHVVTSTPAHEVVLQDGDVQHVEATGPVGIDIQLAWTGTDWAIVRTDPADPDDG